MLNTKQFALIGATTVAATILSAGTALAWHPKGVITKGVTNVTAHGTAVSAADTTGSAVSAKPGDLLKYTIIIRNQSPTAHSYDDLAYTKLTDTLPAGVELVSGKTTDSIGTVHAQRSVTREITVRVKAGVADGSVLDNKACFSGEATNHEKGSQQSGCDHAFVKVHVPKSTPSPTPTPKPTPSPSPKPSTTPTPTPTPTPTGEVLGTATELPQTGAPVAATTVGLGAMVGTGIAYIKSRKRK